MQQWAQAEAELKKALSFERADAVDLKIKMGMVEMRLNKFEAAAVLREATATEPHNALAQFNLGATLLQTGKLDEAETALLRAYEIKDKSMAGAQLLLGQLYFQKQAYEKAITAFQTYLRDLPDAPNSKEVKEAIGKLQLALKKS